MAQPIGSVTADPVRLPGGAVYAMTMGAIASFTRGIARDLGPRGITANNVRPGPTETEIVSAEAVEMLRP